MSNKNTGKRKMKVMIVEDEEDILNLYRDYLSSRGHEVVSCSQHANNIITNFEKYKPDFCLIDHMVGGRGIGIDTATKILEKSPSTPILFITAYESMMSELPKHHEFDDKNIRVLLKPARLSEIENSMLNMSFN
jgi:DNA-binding response OmpR family regulator